MAHKRIHKHNRRGKENNRTERRNKSYGLNGKRSDAVKRKGKHLFKGIFRLARKAFAALIFDSGTVKTYKRNYAAQKQVNLVIFRKRLERASAHKPIIRVVINKLNTHNGHQLIKCVCG